jgi:hypothetical protein
MVHPKTGKICHHIRHMILISFALLEGKTLNGCNIWLLTILIKKTVCNLKIMVKVPKCMFPFNSWVFINKIYRRQYGSKLIGMHHMCYWDDKNRSGPDRLNLQNKPWIICGHDRIIVCIQMFPLYLQTFVLLLLSLNSPLCLYYVWVYLSWWSLCVCIMFECIYPGGHFTFVLLLCYYYPDSNLWWYRSCFYIRWCFVLIRLLFFNSGGALCLQPRNRGYFIHWWNCDILYYMYMRFDSLVFVSYLYKDDPGYLLLLYLYLDFSFVCAIIICVWIVTAQMSSDLQSKS